MIGAKNIPEPQYDSVVWPYMVGQRDGRNDGEKGEAILTAEPNPTALETDPTTQFIFKGRMDRRTFRQAYPTVTVNGVVSTDYEVHDATSVPGMTVEIVGDEADVTYQGDVIDAAHVADLTLDTHSWSRMGVSTVRRVYSFVDRDNDDVYFWHWAMINDGLWGRLGIDKVRADGEPHPLVEGVMQGFMFQWDRSSVGAHATASAGEGANDTIWNYYGHDYDGAQTEDMRLVWVRDGDQDDTIYNATHGMQDDYGDPDPITGELLTARDGGLQFLHFDKSTTDRNDDLAQPRTLGWVNYSTLIQTGPDGHQAKYQQMLYGQEKSGEFYYGDYSNTTLRGDHPLGGSWIKASNDPATSGDWWPDKTLGIDVEVTDCEQQSGYGPNDMGAYDTLNIIVAVGVNGLDPQLAQQVGRDWLAGTPGQANDDAKNAYVFSCKDSIFKSMRQAKAVYEAKTFEGGRYAASRAEFEEALAAAMDQGLISLSPPAPATLTVADGAAVEVSWTLNTTTGSAITGWRLYRALANFKGDSAWTMLGEFAPGVLSHSDATAEVGLSYYYYLTTVDADGHESTMHTRTSAPATAIFSAVGDAAQPAAFGLSQNAPNPFNPNTTIRYSIATAGNVRLEIYSTTGQLVRTLVDGSVGVGSHEVEWNAKDTRGVDVASGAYIYRLQSEGDVQVRRMMLVR